MQPHGLSNMALAKLKPKRPAHMSQSKASCFYKAVLMQLLIAYIKNQKNVTMMTLFVFYFFVSGIKSED